MLDGCADSPGLNAIDIGDRDPRRKKWIFAKIFKVASIHGSTIDVDAGAQEKVDATRARIITQHGAGAVNQVKIPGSRQRDPTRQSGRRTVVTKADWAIGHFQS